MSRSGREPFGSRHFCYFRWFPKNEALELPRYFSVEEK